MVERDESLAVPDSFDTLIDETEKLLDEEGTEEVPEDEGKRNAAFARQRQVNKKLTEALGQMAGLLKEYKTAASDQGRSAPQRVQTSERAAAIRAYRKDVQTRALRRMGRSIDYNDPEDMSDWTFEMMQVIADDRAAAERQQSAARQSPSVVSDVLSRFSQLDDGDKAALKKEIEALPVESQANPEAVQEKVHAYLGRHIGKFSKAPSPKEKDAAEETESDQDEDYNLTTIDDEPLIVRGDEEDLVGRKSSGAAAASGLKSGSKGIRPKPKDKGSDHKAAPQVSKEDREKMKAIDLDPGNAEDVETFRYAERRKGKYAG